MPTLPLTLNTYGTDADFDYPSKHNNDNAAIVAAVNDLYQQVLASSGEGARLILDSFDRPGLIGAASYRLDVDGYPGGAQITIGRRPVADVLKGDVDESSAWISVGGTRTRVTLAGDLVLNAAPIVSGLPKTIYVGIPASGVPQFYEDTLTPGVLYAYSMTWDGFNLAGIKRRVPILPGYTLQQVIAGAPRLLMLFDPETDWVSDALGQSAIVIPGEPDDNGINVQGSMEVLGFFVQCQKQGGDGFAAPAGNPPATALVSLKVVSEGVTWSNVNVDIDATSIPDTLYVGVAAGVGDDAYVTRVRSFRLERVSIGNAVISARAFSWGVIVRPLHGQPAPKLASAVSQV